MNKPTEFNAAVLQFLARHQHSSEKPLPYNRSDMILLRTTREVVASGCVEYSRIRAHCFPMCRLRRVCLWSSAAQDMRFGARRSGGAEPELRQALCSDGRPSVPLG